MKSATTAFDDRYKALNSEQKKAVDTIEGPVMVIAGPGTGKTTILTLRIANILRRTDTPPGGILAITYTDAGVKAMRDKLVSTIGDRAYDVRIHTFHGFAASMIAEYPDRFLHLSGLRQMSDVDQEVLIRDILTDNRYAALRPLGRPDAYLSSIIRSIDEAKRDALTPDMVRDHARTEIVRINDDPASISSRGATKGSLKADARLLIEKCERTLLLADIYAEYEAKKRTEKLMDFNDLIIELLVALRADELFLRLLQERFLYILVDEHQDTNDAQNYVIALIAEFFDTPNIFIVGDEKQAIYRFQGASVDNFLLFSKRYPAMKVIALSTNYRSHQTILDAGFSLIEHNYSPDEHRELRVELVSGAPEVPRPIDIVIGDNVAASEQYLIDEIRRIGRDEPTATVAIITRRNRDLERVLKVMEGASLPVSSERTIDIFTHPVGVLFFDLIEYLADPVRIDALGKTMASGLWGLSITDAAQLSRALKSGTLTDLDARIPALPRIRASLLSDSPIGSLVYACRESGFAALCAQHPAYVSVWRGIMALSESLARERDVVEPRDLLRRLLAYRTSSESKSVKVSVGAPDLPVRALTAHGSKGLEFDYVFIPYATEEAWVGRARGSSFVLPQKHVSSGSDIRDTRRLFYVALTRAKKHVTVLYGLEESDGTPLSPLRFISQIRTDRVSTVALPRVESDAIYTASRMIDTERQSSIIHLAQHVITTSGLSVTALNHYLADPKTFLYESILKLPQAPSVSAEKGRAMHAAMRSVWQTARGSTSEHIESVITEGITSYLASSLLGREDKERVRAELLEDVSSVARALAPHFSETGSVSVERWIETSLSVPYEGTPVDVPLHGQLDVIIETDDEVKVFDYKTRGSMSLAEIRGETKNSDGRYVRQLIFYVMLISANSHWKRKRISASLVFLSPDASGRCPIITIPVTQDDIDRVQGEIATLIRYVWSGDIGRDHSSI